LSFGVFEGVERLSLGYHDIDNHLSVGLGSDATVLVRAVTQKIRDDARHVVIVSVCDVNHAGVGIDLS